MSTLPQETIRKKRLKQALPPAELEEFFSGYLKGDVADYQVSALLMAIALNGMDPEETVALTRVMRDSGTVMSWRAAPRAQIVDKHSTGGVGDKTSLILLPLCILEGLTVPMIAGRGLAHTGGTLDKLEAVGWTVRLDEERAARQLEELGGFIMGQTDTVAPLDRRLYALRDVTDTVESVPLIVGSILSKKLAAGLGALVMDVKFGTGAFMRDPRDARELAEALKRVGTGLGLQMRCLLTSMDSPLGRTAGNALEVGECVEVLRGGGPADTRELSLELATEMIRLAAPARAASEIRARLEGHLASGAAFEAFCRVAAAQGGIVEVLEHPDRMPKAPVQSPVFARRAGIVRRVDVRALGLAVVELGGGRRLVTDAVDPRVGLTAMKACGERVEAGEPLAMVHAASSAKASRAAALVDNAYEIGEAAAAVSPLIMERL